MSWDAAGLSRPVSVGGVRTLTSQSFLMRMIGVACSAQRIGIQSDLLDLVQSSSW